MSVFETDGPLASVVTSMPGDTRPMYLTPYNTYGGHDSSQFMSHRPLAILGERDKEELDLLRSRGIVELQ